MGIPQVDLSGTLHFFSLKPSLILSQLLVENGNKQIHHFLNPHCLDDQLWSKPWR